MKTPRTAVLFLFVLSTLFLATNTHAVLQCGPGIGNPLIYLASATNSHVEPNPSPNGYTIGIGCDDTAIAGFDIALDSTASAVEVLRLSSGDNAHAELPGYVPQVYTNVIKVNDNQPGTLDVQTTSDNDCSAVNGGALTYVPLLHLGRVTNSHAEQPGPSPAYQNTICLAYNAGGVNPAQNIIQTSIPAGGFANVIIGQSAAANILTSNMVFGDPQYSNIATFNVTAICEVGMGDCDALTDYATVNTAITAISQGTYTGSIIPASIKVTKFGSSANQDPITTGLSAQGISVTVNPNPFDVASNNMVYNVDTTALNLAPTKIYRVITLDWRAAFDFPSPGTQWSEDGTQLFNNFASFVFTVLTACGTGVEQCTTPGATPGGCPLAGYTCNQFCMCIIGGSGNTGTAGDVYVLKDIVFPNVYNGSDIVANITVEDKRTDLTGNAPVAQGISTIMRDSQGKLVSAWGTQVFKLPDFTTGSIQTRQILIQAAVTTAPPFLEEGKTYTLYATIQPYSDPDPTPPNLSEITITNNSGYKTFTTLKTPQAYSIPDSPWWMSVLMFGTIVGWLFISARKKEN